MHVYDGLVNQATQECSILDKNNSLCYKKKSWREIHVLLNLLAYIFVANCMDDKRNKHVNNAQICY